MVFVLVFPCFLCKLFSTGSQILMLDNGNLIFLTKNTDLHRDGQSLGWKGVSIYLENPITECLNCLSMILHSRFVKWNERLVKIFNYTAKPIPWGFNFYLSSFQISSDGISRPFARAIAIQLTVYAPLKTKLSCLTRVKS